MAKSKGSKGKKKEVNVDDEEEYESDDEEMAKIDTGDPLSLRNLLNDKVFDYFSQEGYQMSYKWDNMKLICMVLACISGALSHFNGVPFPENKMIILFCVAVFYVISTWMTYHAMFVEKDIVAIAYTKSTPMKKFYVHGQIKRFDEFYRVWIEYEPRQNKTPEEIEKMEDKLYIGQIFDAEGNFDEKTFYGFLANSFYHFQRSQKQE